MIIKAILVLLASMTTSGAYASNQLDRLESLSEELYQLMYLAMIDQFAANGADVTSLRSKVPDTNWDQPMRDAANCVVNEYAEKIGENGIDEMLDKMEAMLPAIKDRGMQAFEETQELQPPGVSEADAMKINEACGMADLLYQQMMGSSFMQEAMELMQGG